MSAATRDDILFVGDIQGCREPLERLLRVAGYSPDRHRLIPVGDTINRGPDNIGVLELLRKMGAEPVQGNHEIKVLETFDSGRDPSWLKRQSVFRDLLQAPQREELLGWMREWPLWHRGEGWIAVHGGVHPVLPLEETPRRFLVNVRVCDAQGNMPASWDGLNESIPHGFRPWYEFYQGRDMVVYGHWARQGVHQTRNTRGLDSGCVYGNPLTGWWLREQRLVQVPGQGQLR